MTLKLETLMTLSAYGVREIWLAPGTRKNFIDAFPEAKVLFRPLSSAEESLAFDSDKTNVGMIFGITIKEQE